MARGGPIVLLGAGAVGRALAQGLAAGGASVVLWSRDPAASRRAVRRLRGAGGRVRAVPDLAEAVAGAGCVLLCVPEPVLPELLLRLRKAPGAPRGAVLLTVSGVADLRLLRRSAGRAPLGRFHPLVPVLARGPASVFRDMPFGIEGPAPARRAARRLCRRLGGFELALSGRDAAGYHAGAALLGGGIVALHQLAELALAPSVRSRAALRGALARFSARNVANVRAVGAAAAMTGPIARAAPDNVRANLRALARVPGGRDAYRALGRVLWELARQKPGAARARLAAVRTLLAE